MSQFTQRFTLVAPNPPVVPSGVRPVSSGATTLTVEFDYPGDPAGITFTPGLFWGNNQAAFYNGPEQAVRLTQQTWHFTMTNLLPLTTYAVVMFATDPFGHQTQGPFTMWFNWTGVYGGSLGAQTTLFGGTFANNTVNYYITGDGFAAGNDQTIFNAAADQVVSALTQEASYWNYLPNLNIIRLNTISNVSGLPVAPTANNYFGTTSDGSATPLWDAGGSRIMQQLLSLQPKLTVAVVLCNSNLVVSYTGVGQQSCALIGTIQMVDVDNRMLPVVMHEVGHGLGLVGDEYGGTPHYTGAEPTGANITINTNRATLKWNSFVLPSTPIPTVRNPSSDCSVPLLADPSLPDTVGLYETGSGFNCDIFHPAAYCLMHGDGAPYCPVCENEVVKRFKSITGLAEPLTPKVTNIISTASGGGSITLRWTGQVPYDQFKVFLAPYKEVNSYFQIYSNSSATVVNSTTWQLVMTGLTAGKRYQIAVEGHTVNTGWSRVTYASNKGFVA